MKKFFLLIATALLVVPLIAADFPKGSPEFVTSYRDAMNHARKTGKPAIIIFSASWCPPCIEMKEDVYPSRKVKAFHNQFVWVYLDRDDPSNDEIAEKFSVNGIPHIEFLDSNGRTLDRLVNAESPREFASRLKSVLSKTRPAAISKPD